MNVVVPKYNTGAIFFPDATDDVGAVFKALDAQMLVTLDYSAIIVLGLTLKSIDGFALDIQTNPQLIVSKASIEKNRLSFIVSAGVGGLTYGLTTTAVYSDGSTKADVLHINVVDTPSDGCCVPGGAALGPISGGLQQAKMDLTAGGVYGNSMPRYYVSPTEPTRALVFDRWYNQTTGVISDYVTDGETSWWQSLYSLEVNLTRISLFYFATSSQITFDTSIPDVFSNSVPLKQTYSLDVMINGVRSIPQTPDGVSGDYVTDISKSTITFKQPLITNDVVILDIVELK